jgi:hypothetical protein
MVRSKLFLDRVGNESGIAPDGADLHFAERRVEQPWLRACGITKRYGSTVALANVELEIRSAEIVALVNILEGKQPTKVSKQGEASRIYVHFPIDIDDNNLQEILTKNTGKPDTFYLDICPNAEEIEANLK